MVVDLPGREPIVIKRIAPQVTPETLTKRMKKTWRIAGTEVRKDAWYAINHDGSREKIEFYLNEGEIRNILKRKMGWSRVEFERNFRSGWRKGFGGLLVVYDSVQRDGTRHVFGENNPYTIHNKIMAYWGGGLCLKDQSKI